MQKITENYYECDISLSQRETCLYQMIYIHEEDDDQQTHLMYKLQHNGLNVLHRHDSVCCND